jgi:ATP phosphoribosyltransferase regulatory subunit HisZ
MSDLRNLLKIADDRLAEINALMTDPGNELINELLEVIEAFGGPQEINRKAQEANGQAKSGQITLFRRSELAHATKGQWGFHIDAGLLRACAGRQKQGCRYRPQECGNARNQRLAVFSLAHR